METLSRLSVQLLVPALVFAALSKTEVSMTSASMLALAYVLYLLILGFMTFVSTRDLPKMQARAVVVSALFGNTGNMGLPITLFAYGQAGLDRAVILLIVSLAMMFVAGPMMLAGGGDLKKRIIETFKLPPVWATVIGVGFNVLGIDIPLSISRGLELLGDASIPLMLVALGMQMQRSWTFEIDTTSIRTTFFRLFLGPLIAYGVGWLLGLSVLDRNVLVLSAALPVAVTMFVIAVEVKGDAAGVAKAVVATTVASLFAIMLVLFLFPV